MTGDASDAVRTGDLGHSDHISAGPGDDDARWMARVSSLTEPEVDALLRGNVPPGSEDLTPVADVARALRRHALHDDTPAMSDDLRAQLAGEAVVVALAPRRALGMAALKAAAAAAAVAVVLVGVGASQNSLPPGVQNAVSSAADLVGVEVPRADDGAEVDADEQPVEPTGEHGDPARDEQGRTPGGATPADPGTPGDGEPATPATPPDRDQGGPPDDVPAGHPDNSTAGPGSEGSGSGRSDSVNPPSTERPAGPGASSGHPADESISDAGRDNRSPKSTR